jgi:CO/xanthine dehydrogenase FAD-binding subunit
LIPENPQCVWRPTDLDQLARLQQERPDRFLLAGGTIALPSWQNGAAPEEVIYLPAIAALRDRDRTWCGAAVTLTDIAAASDYPTVLRQAAASIASPGIRNIATLGGNLAFSGDRCLAVALLALDAWVDCLSIEHATIHRMPLESILHNSKQTIIRVGWTLPTESRSCFTKFGIRATSGMNLATVAVHLYHAANGPNCLFAVGATGVAPHRLPDAEKTWKAMLHHTEAAASTGQAAANEVQLQEVDLLPPDYRREIVGTLIERALRKLVKEEHP